MKSYVALLFGVTLLAACTPYRSTISFYDECAQMTPGFTSMAECGRINRQNYCSATNICTINGDPSVRYADSLVQSIRTRELTEPQAERDWIDYRNNQVAVARQQQLQRRAIEAFDRPQTCFQNSRGRIQCLNGI